MIKETIASWGLFIAAVPAVTASLATILKGVSMLTAGVKTLGVVASGSFALYTLAAAGGVGLGTLAFNQFGDTGASERLSQEVELNIKLNKESEQLKEYWF